MCRRHGGAARRRPPSSGTSVRPHLMQMPGAHSPSALRGGASAVDRRLDGVAVEAEVDPVGPKISGSNRTV